MNSKEIIKSKLKRNIDCNNKGYVENIADNLIDGIDLNMFEDDFRKGNGNELKTKCYAVHSSSILCINNFGLIKKNPSTFTFLDQNGFTDAKFERKFKTGISTPNLDFVLENDSSVIAFESKFLEILDIKRVDFSNSYSKERLKYLDDFWFELIETYKNKKCYLDVAQLLKHAFGMINYKIKNNKKEMILVYIYWTPKDYKQYIQYEKHDEELKSFINNMNKQSDVIFVAMTYSEFWEKVTNKNKNKNMIEHIRLIRDRYDIIINNNL